MTNFRVHFNEMYNKALDMKQYVGLVLLSFIILGSTTVPYSYIVQKHMTWYSAVESCNNKEGILLNDTGMKDFVSSELVSRNLEFEDDWRNLGSQEFWIKQLKYKSPWISAKGCFSGSSSDTSSKSTLHSNTVGTCYQRCSHSDYFATQGNTCKCFSETEFRKLREENGKMCNVTCSGDVKHRCGGAGVYDVYQTTDIHPEPEPYCEQSQDCDCVGLQCDDSKPVYFSDYCQENHNSGCAIRGSLLIGPMGDWSTSFNTCVSLTSKYPLLTSDKIQLSSLCGNNVWIGVFKLTLVSKGIINCPYCRVGDINGTDVLYNVTNCQSFRTSICRYRGDNPPEARIFTTTVSFGILIGILIGVLSCLKLLRQRHNSGTGVSAQVYFTASGSPRTSHVYEGLEENEYVEPI